MSKCPIYTHDGASAKFRTNSHETDYSVLYMSTGLYVHAYMRQVSEEGDIA